MSAEERALIERMRDDAAANGDFQGAANLDALLSEADCTCAHYVVDYSDPERFHSENVDREDDPACPVHSGAFYVLRYIAGTPLAKRKHQHTLGRYPSFEAAEDARRTSPVADLLDVFERTEASS